MLYKVIQDTHIQIQGKEKSGCLYIKVDQNPKKKKKKKKKKEGGREGRRGREGGEREREGGVSEQKCERERKE